MSKFEVKATESLKTEAEKPVIMKESVQLKDRIPCNWHLSVNDNVVYGVNNVSGEEFEGSMEEFNKALRG
jgi:hypothetical protein